MAVADLTNTFEKGMLQDSLKYLQVGGTYRYARNMTKGDRNAIGYGLAVEESNKKVHTFDHKVVGAYYVESLDASVYFTADGSIHLFDHTKLESTFVCKDEEFGCDWNFRECEWISATFKTDQPCDETKVYWSSGCDYYVVNITEMLNPKRKKAIVDGIANEYSSACTYTCDYFKLMKCICSPNLTPIISDKGGHKLTGGTYQFLVQLEDNGGNTTNWFSATDPVSVPSENNQPGEMSLSSIKVHITNLDCRYDKVNIAVIKTVDGVSTARIVETRHYTTDGITYTYYGQDRGRDISLLEIQAKRKMFIKGQDLIQKDSQLYLYNIRQEKNLNMQRRVLDEAVLSFIEIETTAKMVEKHGMRTLERGENYLFGVVYNYCDGTHSPVFLMKPNGGETLPGAKPVNLNDSTGTDQKVTRPRGSASGEGGLLGCPGGRCGGCASGGCGSGGSSGSFQGLSIPTPGDNNDNDVSGNGVLGNIQNWDTNIQDTVDAAKCDDCTEPWCCDQETSECIDCGSNNCEGCQKDEEAIANDMPNIQDIIGKHTDELTKAILDKDPDYPSQTFKTAAEELIKATNEAEFIVVKKSDFKISVSTGSSSTGGGGPILGIASDEGGGGGNQTPPARSDWADEYTDGNGEFLLEEEPKVVGRFAPGVKETEERYPDSVDCDGEFLYGSMANKKLQLFRTPVSDVSPIVEPTAVNVPSKYSTTDPIYAVKIRLLGLEVNNVPQPTDEDLPKPLCPNNPYSIVMVQRDEINSTVQAKGIFFGTFEANAGDAVYTYPRHAANSNTRVDRWIGTADNSRRDYSKPGPGPGLCFFGLDTAIGKVGLSGKTLRVEGTYRGTGFRYGLYEKGKEPSEALTGRRIDQRGTRQYLNLNAPFVNIKGQLFFDRSKEYSINTVGYIEADSVSEITGAKNRVSSKNRESFVYIESDFKESDTDDSFKTDTLNHQKGISGFGRYAAIVRDIPDQYGSVNGMSFIKTGLEPRGFGNTYKGIVGDTFIGPYSFVRKAYVSDKVGNSFPTPERDRTVCDSPNDLLLQQFGLDFYSTKLPISGDRSDAKNWAGGYLDGIGEGDPQFDYYYPKVVKTLITTWVESRINPWYRATGFASGKESGEVFYPKLKDLYLDSNSNSQKHPWEESFLNRFYYRLEQPSVAQLLRKYIIKTIILMALPMLGLDNLNDMEGPLDTTATLLTAPIMTAYWYVMKNLLTRNDYLDRMLGLPSCQTDAAGGEPDNFIENFEDNYHAYNYDHSRLNIVNVYQTMPSNYNTCDCDDCLNNQTTNEVFYSGKQVQGSQIDFYKQFKALSYLVIPADIGKLRKMFNVNGDFYAHTSDFIIPLKFKNVNIQTSIGTTMLGGDQILDEPTPFFEGVQEGFAGNIDPNAAVNTQLGYVFIDRAAKKIFLFNGKSPTDISAIGMSRFFNEHLDICEVDDCHDEKNEDGTYYSIGYDPEFKRLLLTKKELDEEKSFTMSLDMSSENPTWVSFHDYIPQHYIWDRSKLYSIKDKSIYMHNANDGTYRTFYEEEHPSEIEFVAVGDSESFTYDHTFINTEAEKNQVKNLDETFNKIAAYNTTEGTGTRNTTVFGDNADTRLNPNAEYTETGDIKLHKVKRGFRFNTLKDNVKKNCGEYPLTIKEECKPIEKINESIFSNSPEQRRSYRGKVLQDDHIVYRFTYDKDKETLLRLLSVKTYASKEIR
jgi:hypothetical protein